MGGRRIRRALSTDKRHALEKLADLIKQRQALRHGTPVTDLSWDAFRTRYKAYSATKHPQTAYRDELAFRKLEAAFTFARLHQLTVEKLEEFKGILFASGNRVTTVNRDLRAIKAALNKAAEWKMIEPNQYKTVRYFKEAKGRLSFFTVPEIQNVQKQCNGVWRTILMLGYYAGLRREEIYTLKTSCLDFDRGRIHIEPSEEWTPKDYERRFVPMHQDLREYLSKLKPSVYVLGDSRPCPDVMTNYFRKLVHKAGLEGNLHKLRHSFGSHMAMAGVPIAKIQKWMGHADLTTTMIYAHLSPDHLDKAIESLPGLTSAFVPRETLSRVSLVPDNSR